MSLAIAAVTRVLRGILQAAVAEEGVVSALPPGRGVRSGAERIVLHLFLYRVESATGRLPGSPASPPGLAVDLHYLVAAEGRIPYEDELFMAAAMAALHANPVVPRSVLEHALSGAPSGLGATSDVRVMQEPLSIADLSALWRSLEAPARLAVGYRVTGLVAGPDEQPVVSSGAVVRLPRDPFRVDLAQVVSKYIKQTEERLDRVFDAAERAGEIVSDDEADDLFGRRDD